MNPPFSPAQFANGDYHLDATRAGATRETSAAKKRRCAAANEKGTVQSDTRLSFRERSDSICVFPVIRLNIKPRALKSRTL